MATKINIFGSVLSRIRKEQGYPSAYQFFKSVGGSKTIGISFGSYWDLERGKKLPKSWRLKAIMSALDVGQYSPKAQELVRAYFKELSGSDELLQILSGPPAARGNLTSSELTETAIEQALKQRRVNMTLEQWKIFGRDAVTHICQYFLVNTAGWVTVRELSDTTKFKEEEIRKALGILANGGLVEFSKDKARSLFQNKVVPMLALTPETAAIHARQRKLWSMWLADCKTYAAKRTTVRMTKENMEIYRQQLEKTVAMCAVYENMEANRQDSAIYCVESRVYQILPKE